MKKENMDKYNIWLTLIFGRANPKIHEVIRKYGSSKAAYEAVSEGDTSVLTAAEKEQISYATMDKVERLIEYCGKRGIKICSLGSRDYPKLLAEIYDPPVVFYYRGDLSCLDELTLTFIGARKATDVTLKNCAKVTYETGRVGVTLVSGMAIGTDQCVHRTCVRNGLKTVGVLGCGIDYEYPKGTFELREQMIMYGGAVISELLPREEPSKDYFNPRNRIMAGLSRGTAIFQASVMSGTLITASYAVNENRDVFCVPPPDVFDATYDGVKSLIDDGAILLFDHIDILKEYVGLYI